MDLDRMHRQQHHDRDVRIERDGEEWHVAITVPNAFDASGDVGASHRDEMAALDAVRSFELTGELPDGFEPAVVTEGPSPR